MSTNKLYVGNIPFSSSDQTLIDLFSQCGSIESAKVITDRDTGRGKGFGFVEMSSSEEAAEAIKKFNGYQLEGRAITVNEAKPKESSGGGGSRPPRRERW